MTPVFRRIDIVRKIAPFDRFSIKSKFVFLSNQNEMAKSEQCVDWQSTKNTVLERSRHMFNNPFMSDITFSCDGSDKKFFAHKYVLSTSSAVFYAMFYGKLAEKNSLVHLSDTSEEVLEEFLRYLYTDECDLTADNAMFVLYLAKKYIVPALAQKCIGFVEINIEVENVVTILQQAIQFDEENLESKCWVLIDHKTSKVIASDAFVDINQATLEKLLKRESLRVQEVDLFKAVLKWSEVECSRKEIQTNVNNKRAVMGNAIYQIRFASMTLQEFGQNVSQLGILTPQENVLFFERFSGIERTSEVWNLSERRAGERTLFRCCRFKSHDDYKISSKDIMCSEHTIWVSFSKPVNFHGVRFLGEKGQEYDVKLEVISQSVKKKFRSQRDSRRLTGFDVMLPVPIKVQANFVVQLKATITSWQYPNSYYFGIKGRKAVETNGIMVNFFNTPGVHSSATTVEQGQFDEIIFSEI